MKLTFLGAAREVTGSRYLLEACGKNILVDYGMEQGSNLFENAKLPIAAANVDYVFLTHAHIDNSGWLPLLYKQGFRGKIFTTEATVDLARLAGYAPCGVLCELTNPDGTMAKGEQIKTFAAANGLPLVTVAALAAYRQAIGDR